MKPLRQQFIDKMIMRGFAEKTIKNYINTISGLSRHYRCNPLTVTKEQIQDWLLFLHQEKKHAPATINLKIGALKTFFKLMAPGNTIMANWPGMKKTRRLPLILSRGEVDCLIASIKNLRQRALVMLLYSAGLRLNECIMLQPHHIESARMKIRIEHAKGT